MKISKILISQPAPASPDKSPFTEVLTKHKVSADFIPLMKMVGVSAKEFRSQKVDVLSFTAVIFTSRITIDNFFHICEECRISIPETMKYFCSTEAIALYLQKYIVYRKRKIFFGKSCTSDFMDVIIKHKEEKFIMALSEPHSDELPNLFLKAKLKFQMLILARSVNNDAVGKDCDIASYDMFVAYSRNDIASLKERFGDKIGKTAIATFGTGTAKAAMEASLNVQLLAPTKEAPSMAMALDHYLDHIEHGDIIDTTYISDNIKDAISSSDQLIAKIKPAKSRKSASKSCSTTTKSSSTTTKKRVCKATAPAKLNS